MVYRGGRDIGSGDGSGPGTGALPHSVLSFFVYFETVEAALDGVLWLRGEETAKERPNGPWDQIEPRCIELFDSVALDIIRPKAGASGVSVPDSAGAMLFIEQEVGEGQDERLLEAWFDILMAMTPLGEEVTVAENSARQRVLRDLRHHVPATLNEEARGYREAGGRKISTDWAVPISRLHEAFQQATARANEVGASRSSVMATLGTDIPTLI